MDYRKPKVISEIGCNHKGEMEIAFDLIKLSKDSGADVAKFQKRNPKEYKPLKLSNDRILTTHVGSLPRTAQVFEMLNAKEQSAPKEKRACLGVISPIMMGRFFVRLTCPSKFASA